MTLLIAARTKDGLVAVSDRKESVAGAGANEVTKCHLDAAGEFCLALSGDGAMAARILRDLKGRRIRGAAVFREIEILAARLHAQSRSYAVLAGHLVVVDGGKIKMYTVSIRAGITVFGSSTDAVPAEGDYGATAVCKNLAQGMELSSMTCEAAARYLHTLADRAAETVESVGRRSEYGIDMVVFKEGGGAWRLERRAENLGTIDVRFRESGSGPLFGRNGGI